MVLKIQLRTPKMLLGSFLSETLELRIIVKIILKFITLR